MHRFHALPGAHITHDLWGVIAGLLLLLGAILLLFWSPKPSRRRGRHRRRPPTRVGALLTRVRSLAARLSDHAAALPGIPAVGRRRRRRRRRISL